MLNFLSIFFTWNSVAFDFPLSDVSIWLNGSHFRKSKFADFLKLFEKFSYYFRAIRKFWYFISLYQTGRRRSVLKHGGWGGGGAHR